MCRCALYIYQSGTLCHLIWLTILTPCFYPLLNVVSKLTSIINLFYPSRVTVFCACDSFLLSWHMARYQPCNNNNNNTVADHWPRPLHCHSTPGQLTRNISTPCLHELWHKTAAVQKLCLFLGWPLFLESSWKFMFIFQGPGKPLKADLVLESYGI